MSTGGIVLFSDPHFDNRSQFGKYESNPEFPGCNSRFHEIAKTFRTALAYAKAKDCEAMFVLGDIFHTRGHVAVPVYNAVYRLLEEAASTGVALFLYPGNHDFVDLKAMHAEHSLHSLFMYNSVCHIIDQPEHVETDNFAVGIIPFSLDLDAITLASKNLLPKTKKQTALMLHHSVNGAVTGPHEWQMPNRLNVTDLEQGWDLIFSGHYHKHQNIDKLTYVGAPLQHDFGEREYTPGFIHVKPDGSWKVIENKTSPRFVVLETEDSRDLSALDSKNYNVVRWQGEEKVGEALRDTTNALVEIRPATLNKIARSDISTTDSVEEMFKKYMKARTGTVSNTLLKKGLAFYKETL
jgi:DNA repair exonuclease SbcCD nuclease subunit